MRVLQETLRQILLRQGYIALDFDFVTEVSAPMAKGVFYQDFQSRPFFIWYDYFSVPQREKRASLHEVTDESHGSNHAKAINSIPAYVAKCRFFFALCPTIDCPEEGKVLSATSLAERGWCLGCVYAFLNPKP